mmetsp:Transcript_107924/g.281744  ORF Transcript_107924/g.281744 Transcript_107924/m.281744 type:complete len:243 (+) Transcript_107924:371-1099(+)
MSSIVLSRSLNFTPSTFLSSSAVSNSFSQYDFLPSSASCSCASRLTISSIIFSTLSKPFAPPCSAISISVTRPSPLLAVRSALSALLRTSLLLTCSWSSEGPALGNVFVNKSSASSSFRILMVSAMASSSSVRILVRSSCSCFFVAQPLLSSARKALSSARVLAVSSLSSFMLAISRPSSPEASSFCSIAVVSASISAVLAAISASKTDTAFSSEAWASLRSFSMVSCICCRMPEICPACGA